jgi:GH25 family lysozyme M1 (1,4-beta-N-acetylmuramidase)
MQNHDIRPVLRATLAAAAVAVTALAVTAGTASAAPATSSANSTAAKSTNSASTARHHLARTVTGKLVPVTPTNHHTPVHPEAITHPSADTMSSVAAAASAASTVKAPEIRSASSVPQLPGIDVSDNQGDINWASVAPNIDFSYAKATEGTYYTNGDFANQYNGPYDYGVIRGAYHFAIPNNSGGTAQADYFIANGGGWSDDGLTLPGALDIEYNPYGAECYGLSQSSMVDWVADFVNEYASREGVYPIIYTTTDWWTTCTGNYSGFATEDPLWVANYSASAGGTLPAGWGYYTFWQYADSGSEPGDQDVFNGAYSQLQVIADKG